MIIYAGREGTLSLSEGSVTPSYVSRGTHTIRLHINPSEKNFEIYMSELTLTDKANNKTRKNLNPFAINSEDFEEAHIDDITREGIGSFLTFTIEFADKKQHNLDNISLNTNYGDISINNSSISTTTNDLTYSIIAGPFLYGLEYTNLTLTVNPTKGSNVVYTDSVKYGGLGNHTPNGSYKLLEYVYVKCAHNYTFTFEGSYHNSAASFTENSILPYYRFLPTYDYYRLDLSNIIPIGDISFILDNDDNTPKIASDLSMETSFNLVYFDSNKYLAEKQLSAINNYYYKPVTPTSGVRKQDTSNIPIDIYYKTNNDWKWEVSGVTPHPSWSSNIWKVTEPNNSSDSNKHIQDHYFRNAIIYEGYADLNIIDSDRLWDVTIFKPEWDAIKISGGLYLREHNVVSITDLCDTIIDICNTNANITYSNDVPFRGFLIKDNCDNLIDSPLLSGNNIPITSTMLSPNSNAQKIEHAVKTMYS